MFIHALLHGIHVRGLGGGLRALLSLCVSRSLRFFSFMIPLVRISSSWDRRWRGQRGACNVCRHRADGRRGKIDKVYAAIV